MVRIVEGRSVFTFHRILRAAKAARLLTGMRGVPPSQGSWPELYHHPHSLSWFESQDWPFKYKLDTFSVLSNNFIQHHISDDWRGRTFLDVVFAFQQLAPGYCGRRGLMPAIVIGKDM